MTSHIETAEGPKKAEFYERTRCISCDSERLGTLDRGLFGRDPHRSMILNSPWGVSPLPYLEHCEWELVRCEDCAQVFHKRLLTPEWEAVRFAEWHTKEAIDQFEEEHGANTPAAALDRARTEVAWVLSLEKMTRQLRRGEAMRILDFGCGWGRMVAFASLFGCEAYGIDRSDARLEGETGIGRIFQSIEDFRAEVPESLHVVSLFQVLEHLPEPAEVLRSLRELIVPSGLLVLEVPDASGVDRLRTQTDLVVGGIDHINAFTPDTLSAIAERAGFERIKRSEIAHVTADFLRVAKREVKRVVRRFQRPSTAQLFKRV